MPHHADHHRRRLLTLLPALLPAGMALTGCASLGSEPLRVNLVGLSSLPGEGLEWRMRARLRVQNPTDREIVYDGVSLELDLRGQRFASGVAPLTGTVGRYAETVIEVPLTISGLAVMRQLFDLVRQVSREEARDTRSPGAEPPSLPYALRGRLGGGLFGHAFDSSGTVPLPDFGPGRS